MFTPRSRRPWMRVVAALVLATAFAFGPAMASQQPERPPLVVAVLVQEGAGDYLATDIGLRELVKRLPAGSYAMTAYLTSSGLRVTQPFTTDLESASRALYVPPNRALYTPNFFLYHQVLAALSAFDGMPSEGRVAVVLSDGLNRGLTEDVPLGRAEALAGAIVGAKARDVAVYAIFRPSLATSYHRSASNLGLDSLGRLARETGGDVLTGTVDYLRLGDRLARQGRAPG